MPAMIDWAASTVLTLPAAAPSKAARVAASKDASRGSTPERGERLDLVGVADDPQRQALLGPHLGDVEPRSPLEPHAQGERAAAGPGPVGGKLVLPPDPAPPGQMHDQPLPVEVHAQVLPTPCDRHDVATHERRQGRVEGLERGDGTELAPLDAPAGGALGQEAGESLDFGQLGHASILPRPG